ncbi:MAG TPA: S-methyl-5'-thioinosine phosphorylase [Clostridia bacterium]|nr:S-methyl-5'-thioinosine phosphorylase [Clostridia bacterium]
MEKAIIGGTGVYDVAEKVSQKTINTKYGKVDIDVVTIEGENVAFLARHGKGHGVPPHLVNYRANIMALKHIGVKYIYATAAVGSLNENYAPGEVVVLKDFIDFTKVRPFTFFEGEDGVVRHVDMSDPYCSNLREKFYKAAQKEGLSIKGDAVYVCTEGPRFETASEIKAYKMLGADVVGMTNVPEVVLAKELGICYVAVGIVTNWATGMAVNSKGHISLREITSAIEVNKEKVIKTFIRVFLEEKLDQDHCHCSNSVIEL